MPQNTFYDLNGRYTVDGRATTIEGMVGVKSGAVNGIIVEDVNMPIGPATEDVVVNLVGGLAEREGEYDGLVFLINHAALQEAREFPIVGNMQLKLKATPETKNMRKAL